MDSGEFAAPDPGDAGVATDSGPVSLEVPAGTSRPIPGDVILTLEDVSKGFRTGPLGAVAPSRCCTSFRCKSEPESSWDWLARMARGRAL
jgi:hypothetical protein